MKPLDTIIDDKWLELDKSGTETIREWISKNTGLGATAREILSDLRSQGEWYHIRHILIRLMNRDQKVEWAIYCSEKSLENFEKKYPDDNRPRDAIEMAKKQLKNPSESLKTKENLLKAVNASYEVLDMLDRGPSYAASSAASTLDAAVYYENSAAYSAQYAAASFPDRKLMDNEFLDKAIEILSR